MGDIGVKFTDVSKPFNELDGLFKFIMTEYSLGVSIDLILFPKI